MRERAVSAFLDHVRAECRRYKVRLYLSRGRNIRCDDGAMATGEFEGWRWEGTLRVSVGRCYQSAWLGVMAHEFGHMMQWVEHDAAWRAVGGSNRLFRWLDHKVECRPATVLRDIRAHQAMELDADRRALAMIRRFDLPVDRDEYVRAANAYIWSYVYTAAHRRWNGVSSPPSVLAMMPTRLLPLRAYRVMPPGYEEIVTRYSTTPRRPAA